MSFLRKGMLSLRLLYSALFVSLRPRERQQNDTLTVCRKFKIVVFIILYRSKIHHMSYMLAIHNHAYNVRIVDMYQREESEAVI